MHVFGLFRKSQQVNFATNYLKFTTRQYWFRYSYYFQWNHCFYGIFWYNPTPLIYRILPILLEEKKRQGKFSDNSLIATWDVKSHKNWHKNGEATENIDVKSLNRFLDDLISIFIGSTQALHKLWQKMNEIHPSVKFTTQHSTIPNYNTDDRCDC